MKSNLNRRNWLKKGVLATTSLLLAPYATKSVQAAISSTPEQSFAPYPLLDYKTGEPIRLHWNENPYGASPKAIQAATDALQDSNRYPIFETGILKTKIAEQYGLKAENVLVTAGSTEVLTLIGQYAGLQKGELLSPWFSFPTMPYFAESTGANIHYIPLNDREELDLNRLKENITDKTTVISICNPNNPTSTEVNKADLEAFCRAVPENVLICVDEAYIEFSKMGAKGSMMHLVKELPNLIVSRTFSKAYGLSGLRIGYAVSQKSNIDTLMSRHLGRGISTGFVPLRAAVAALDDQEFIQKVVKQNEESRQVVYDAFDKWEIDYCPSSTNFIYAKDKRFQKDLVAKIKTDNILLTKWPFMTDTLRISLSKPNEMRYFVEMVEKYLV